MRVGGRWFHLSSFYFRALVEKWHEITVLEYTYIYEINLKIKTKKQQQTSSKNYEQHWTKSNETKTAMTCITKSYLFFFCFNFCFIFFFLLFILSHFWLHLFENMHCDVDGFMNKMSYCWVFFFFFSLFVYKWCRYVCVPHNSFFIIQSKIRQKYSVIKCICRRFNWFINESWFAYGMRIWQKKIKYFLLKDRCAVCNICP